MRMALVLKMPLGVLLRPIPNCAILVIPAGYPRRLAHYYPNFNSTLNMQHVTKWAEPITMGKAVPEIMRRAFFQLRNGRPGPVMIEVPLDVMNEEVPDSWIYEPAFSAKSGPNPTDVEAAAAVLAQAKHPVIYAGQGVHYAKAWDELIIPRKPGIFQSPPVSKARARFRRIIRSHWAAADALIPDRLSTICRGRRGIRRRRLLRADCLWRTHAKG